MNLILQADARLDMIKDKINSLHQTKLSKKQLEKEKQSLMKELDEQRRLHNEHKKSLLQMQQQCSRTKNIFKARITAADQMAQEEHLRTCNPEGYASLQKFEAQLEKSIRMSMILEETSAQNYPQENSLMCNYDPNCLGDRCHHDDDPTLLVSVLRPELSR